MEIPYTEMPVRKILFGINIGKQFRLDAAPASYVSAELLPSFFTVLCVTSNINYMGEVSWNVE